VDGSRASALQKAEGIPACFDRRDAMLQECRPDVVHVLLPPTMHASASETCLNSGCHIFVEKPLCITADECRRVQLLADRNGLEIGVNHNLTFMPAFLKLIDAVRAGRFGAIEQVQVMYTIPMPGLEAGPHSHWIFGGTERLMLEIGPHPLSICVRLLGQVVGASTAASGELKLSNGVRFFRTWQSSLVCERGAAQCTLSVGGKYFAAMVHVVGEDAQGLVDLRRNSIQIIEKTPYLRLDDMVNGWKTAYALARQNLHNFKAYALGAAGLGPPYQQQTMSVNASVGAFYRALAAGRSPRINGQEGAAVVEACQKTIDAALAYLAQQEGRVVGV
jgi:predicted dehydrogenase